MANWFYYKNNKTEGPVTYKEIHAMLNSQQITNETPLWTKKIGAWTLLSDVHDFKDVTNLVYSSKHQEMDFKRDIPAICGDKDNLPKSFFRFTDKYFTMKRFINSKILRSFSLNAYRILELSIDATEDEILKKAEVLKRKSRLGVEHTSIFGIDLLEDIKIDEKLIWAATNRLLNPKLRFLERLFWFYDVKYYPINSLVEEYKKLSDYMALFYDSLEQNKISNFRDLYSITLLGLIYLVLDDFYLASRNSWVDVYNLLFFIINDINYLQHLQQYENGGCFSKPFRYDIEELKENVIRLLLEPLQMLIEEHLQNSEVDCVSNGIKIISTLNISDDLSDDIINKVLFLLEDDVMMMCKGIMDDCSVRIQYDDDSAEDNRALCNAALDLFDQKVSQKLETLLKYSSHPILVKRVKESAADFFYNLAIYFTWGGDYISANELLHKAKTISTSDSIQSKKINRLISNIMPDVNLQKMSKKKKTAKFNEEIKTDEQPVIGRTEKSMGKDHKVNKSIYIWIALIIGVIFIGILKLSIDKNETGFISQNQNSQTTERHTTIEYDNAKYVGEVSYRLPDGYGTLTFFNGNSYVGNFIEGKFHGQGTYTWSDGHRYEGQWTDGAITGFGICTWPNGDSYEGYFKDSKMNGQGTYFYNDGSQLNGYWLNDEYLGSDL